MIELKGYAAIYIIDPRNGDLIGEIENHASASDLKLEYLSLFLNNGHLLRCFTTEGFVETYLIEKSDDRAWPELRRVSLPDRIENN
jgi:hypothetical protein